MKGMKLINTGLLEYYKKNQPMTILKHFNRLKIATSQSANLSFFITISAVYSSRIEGSQLMLSDYMKIYNSGMNTSNKDYLQVQDLIKAYEYAKGHSLNLKNLFKIHELATESLISTNDYKGKLRDKEVGVYNEKGELIFQGCKVQRVKDEIDKLFEDIKALRTMDLTYDEIFYFASMIHLHFAGIHPFADGNGRTARLLEKWFLSEKLGTDAWKIQSEKLYQTRIKSYYNNINLGKTYEGINYDAAFPFLKMLPTALKLK